LPFLRDAFLRPQVLGSDHCPVGVDLDPAVAAR
jgi:exodeoxyribonuclease-3